MGKSRIIWGNARQNFYYKIILTFDPRYVKIITLITGNNVMNELTTNKRNQPDSLPNPFKVDKVFPPDLFRRARLTRWDRFRLFFQPMNYFTDGEAIVYYKKHAGKTYVYRISFIGQLSDVRTRH